LKKLSKFSKAKIFLVIKRKDYFNHEGHPSETSFAFLRNFTGQAKDTMVRKSKAG
jgi:hypothetical protein